MSFEITYGGNDDDGGESNGYDLCASLRALVECVCVLCVSARTQYSNCTDFMVCVGVRVPACVCVCVCCLLYTSRCV